jgi:predicted transcriptional regulator
VNDIFDLFNTDDLPESILKELRKKKRVSKLDLIMDVLKKAKQPITIDKVMVGVYRLHQLDLPRKEINSALYTLVKSNKVKIISKYPNTYAMNVKGGE